MAPSSPIPPTLLTLRLSSPSFLETVLTNHGTPIYSTETYGSTTSLSRCDPATGLDLIANIHWPEHHRKGKAKDASCAAQLFLNGTTMCEDELLKRNCLNTSRKFRIPGHSHSLKWRRVHGVFQCTTSAGTPVAVFEPPIITARARLNVFVSTLSGLPEPRLHSTDDVSALLVDYLLVTALLLLTHPEDWHGFNATPTSTPITTPTHARTLPALPHLAIPASPAHSHAHTYRPSLDQLRSASTTSPISPVSSAVSEYSTSSSRSSSSTWERQHPLHAHREQVSSSGSCQCASPRRTRSDAVLCLDGDDVARDLGIELAQEEVKEVVEYEPPPPYEEIQWTVRVRQPRRARV